MRSSAARSEFHSGQVLSRNHCRIASQNWQSEFLSTAVLVVLSVFLRQRNQRNRSRSPRHMRRLDPDEAALEEHRGKLKGGSFGGGCVRFPKQDKIDFDAVPDMLRHIYAKGRAGAESRPGERAQRPGGVGCRLDAPLQLSGGCASR